VTSRKPHAGSRTHCVAVLPPEVAESVAGATTEAFARWLHHRHGPIELPLAGGGGHVVSPRDNLLPRDALQCKARSCYHLSSVRPSIRLSVCLSVTLVDHDHLGGKTWKLIARTINSTSSLFVAKRSSTYSHGEILVRLGWGGKKWHAGAQKRQYL